MTPEAIMPRIIAGGEDREFAVRVFYERYASAMMRFYMYRGLSADEAQDVFQNTLIKVIRNAASYHDSGQENAWFWQISRNVLTDYQRQKYRSQEIEVAVEYLEDLPVAAPETDTAVQSVDGCVESGLSRFKEKEPDRVYALSLQMNGYSIKEIGERIGRTVAATKEYLSQCRKKAQPFVAHCFELLKA
jgi:RNA polymerase sigma-70 factor (ECF subfamily)